MSKTVIGIFQNVSEAWEAKKELLSKGFADESIDISANDTTTRSVTGRSAYDHEETGERVGNFFKNLFGNDEESTTYTEAARQGTVVTVHAKDADEAERALTVLDSYGAVDVNDYAKQCRMKACADDEMSGSAEQVLPVIEEDLEVGKREVGTGGVRLRSRIIERPVEESIRLRQEHVHVERTAVDRPATDADFENFREGTIEMKEHEEVPVVKKEARVVEEVSLGKSVSETEETIKDTLRSTEVDTEHISSSETRNTDSDKRSL